VLAGTADETYEFIFLDSKRTEYAAWWPDLRRVLRPGGPPVAADRAVQVAEGAPRDPGLGFVTAFGVTTMLWAWRRKQVQLPIAGEQPQQIGALRAEGRERCCQRSVAEVDCARPTCLTPLRGQRSAYGQTVISDQTAQGSRVLWQRDCLLNSRIHRGRLIADRSQAIVHGGFVFVAGQLPFVPGSSERVVGTIEEQTEQVLRNISAVLEAAGSSLARTVQMTIYVSDMELWGRVNTTYARVLGNHKPARAVVPVGLLHYGYQIEVQAIGAVGKPGA
jgi:2-iminobutanoate/2-iminopropanoate deaminase